MLQTLYGERVEGGEEGTFLGVYWFSGCFHNMLIVDESNCNNSKKL